MGDSNVTQKGKGLPAPPKLAGCVCNDVGEWSDGGEREKSQPCSTLRGARVIRQCNHSYASVNACCLNHIRCIE